MNDEEQLRTNIKELQQQLQQAYIRIGELNMEIQDLKRYKDAVDDGKILIREDDESVLL